MSPQPKKAAGDAPAGMEELLPWLLADFVR